MIYGSENETRSSSSVTARGHAIASDLDRIKTIKITSISHFLQSTLSPLLGGSVLGRTGKSHFILQVCRRMSVRTS